MEKEVVNKSMLIVSHLQDNEQFDSFDWYWLIYASYILKNHILLFNLSGCLSETILLSNKKLF